MASTLPPDPYKALGVSKDVDAATIKSTYRKLVLKCHPDKVTDESLKQQKQEEFHKIQQAYELIGDEDKRATYDAEVKLEQLRADKKARAAGSPHVEVKTARYDVRTAAPGQASFSATGAHRYTTQEHKPTSRPHDDDRYYEERSRRYDTYEAYPKHSSTTTRSSRKEDPPIRVSRVSTDRTRSDHKKERAKEERRERSGRFVSVESESSADEKARYEADYKRRSDEARRRQDEEEAQKQAYEARRKADTRRADERRSYDEARYDRQRKLSDLENDAVRYIHRSKVEGETRPSPNRTSSSRDVRPEHYESRSSRKESSRPEAVRRSSARPKDRPSSGRDRDRKGPEIVEWEEDRKMPSFKQSSSSPADLHVPRTVPQRSYTESSRDHRRTETSPTPMFRRSETMPSVPHSSSRRTEAKPTRPSTLRSSETAPPHVPSRDTSPETQYPTVPAAQSSSGTKKYYYPTPGGGVSLRPEDVGVANGHRTVLREPDNRNRHRSPSPLTRPPMGANRPVETAAPQYTTASPKSSMQPPPLGRTATINASTVGANEERGRSSRPLYGEINSDYTRRENARRQTSFSPDQVSYTQKIGPDDIRWAPTRGRESEREYASRPTLGRTATLLRVHEFTTFKPSGYGWLRKRIAYYG